MFNNRQLRSHEYLQVYCTHLKCEVTCPHYILTQNFIHDLTFAFSLINADGRKLCSRGYALGSSYSPDPSSPLSHPPTRKGLGTKLGWTISHLVSTNRLRNHFPPLVGVPFLDLQAAFSQVGAQAGRRALTVESSLSGCGWGHEPKEIVPKKLQLKFPVLAPSRSRNTIA